MDKTNQDPTNPNTFTCNAADLVKPPALASFLHACLRESSPEEINQLLGREQFVARDRVRGILVSTIYLDALMSPECRAMFEALPEPFRSIGIQGFEVYRSDRPRTLERFPIRELAVARHREIVAEIEARS